MSANLIDLLKKCIKPCFILLERLDEEIAKQFMQKEESNLKEIGSGVTNRRFRRRRRGRSSKKCSKFHKKKESASSGDQIPRKRSHGTKPLCYLEDEEDLTPPDPKEIVLEMSDGATKHEVESFFFDADGDEIPEEKRPNLTEELNCIDDSNNLNECKKTAEEEESKGGFESEVENMEEFGKPAITGSLKSEVVCNLMPKEELEEEEEEGEIDLMNKSEDERETVVFDGDFNDDTKDVAFFEMAEKGVKNENRKLKKRKIMNRRRRKLVKFKRKRSMMGRNLAKVEKLTKKPPEFHDSCPDVSERESCLSEICALVKRLHELHVIISHLQVHLPKDPQLANHFAKTISVQKEKFHSEIIGSHKAIVSGCKRLLSFYGSSNKVSWKIRKRTFLSKKDVADVLSWCTVMEMVGEKNGRKSTGEQKLNSAPLGVPPEGFELGYPPEKPKRLISHSKEGQLPLETVPVQREKSPAFTQSAVAGTILASAPLPSNPSENCSMKPPQKPSNNLKMARDSTAKNNSWTDHLPSEHIVRAQQYSGNPYREPWDVFSKPKTSPQKCYNQRATALMRDPRGWQLPQDSAGIIPRSVQMNYPRIFRVHNQPSNPRIQYRGCGFPPQDAGPGIPTNYAPNCNPNQWRVPGAFMFSVPQSEMTERARPSFPVPSLISLNNIPRINLVYQYPQTLNSASSTTFCPQPLSQNFHESAFDLSHSVKISRGPHVSKSPNAPRKRSSIKKTVEPIAPKQPYSGGSCPVKPPVTVSTECLQPAPESRAPTVAVGESPSVTEKVTPDANGPEECTSFVLDPTVPQKLTLKNHRLEAGPVLEVKTNGLEEGDSVNAIQWQKPVKEEELLIDDGVPENVRQKESKSRVYVCAQNKCKRPGIEICKGCLSIIYCSVTCQLQHWTQKHKNECHQLKELRGCEVKNED